MNSRRPQQAAALVLSLVLTLAIFSGVACWRRRHDGAQMLVQVSTPDQG